MKTKSVAVSYNSMKGCLNTDMLLQKAHQGYVAVGGEMKGSMGAKSILKYASAEVAANWQIVVEYAYSLVCKNKEIKGSGEKIDWRQVCMYNTLLKELSKKCKTEYAYKELVEMAAINLGLDVKSVLAEAILDAYGWNNVVTEMVATYESKMRGCEVSDITAVENIVDERPQVEVSVTAAPKKSRAKKSVAPHIEKVPVVISVPVAKKHASKCKAVKQIFGDGTTKYFGSVTEASHATKICAGSISRNLGKYKGYPTVTDKSSGRKCKFEYAENR